MKRLLKFILTIFAILLAVILVPTMERDEEKAGS